MEIHVALPARLLRNMATLLGLQWLKRSSSVIRSFPSKGASFQRTTWGGLHVLHLLFVLVRWHLEPCSSKPVTSAAKHGKGRNVREKQMHI